MLQDIHIGIDDRYTHFKVLEYILRIEPEGFAHLTLDEIAKNSERSVPTAFKSYHTDAPGLITFNIFHNQVFKYTPKFMTYFIIN